MSVLLLALLATGSTPVDHTAPPNIIYVMADELGYYELSHMGHPHIQTPRIDRMASEGVRFTHALSGSSLCAPTRCVLMTGKHTGHTSVRTNGGGTPLRAGEETIASVLKRAGYATGGFGKWGCGGRGSTGVPEEHGFDRFFGYYDQVHAHSYYPPYLVDNSREVALPGNEGGRSGETYAHDAIMDEAKAFLRKHADQPFFLYLPVTPPHGMFDIPDADPAWATYRDEPWPEEARRYAAMVSRLDRDVGELLDMLTELELDERTLVFFCGDNGGNDYFKSDTHPRGFHGPNVHPTSGVEFRGRKGTLYEGGLRIPMIARWPGRIEAGRVDDHVWSFPDVLPTLSELAGATPPDDIDGVSIVPALLGAEQAGRPQAKHPHLYWELGGQVAVRQGTWKAIRPGAKREWELYDLSQDPSETNDLAGQHVDKLAELIAIAEREHEPAVEGIFTRRDLHQRDQKAKWGSRGRPGSTKPAVKFSTDGLLDRAPWVILDATSESASNGRLATTAIDGDPRTHWHTRFSPDVAEPPHELLIDLGDVHPMRGVRLLARQDGGWNGAIAACEVHVGTTRDHLVPVLSTTFKKTRDVQEATFDVIRGRYVLLRALSEVDGRPFASLAEFGVLKGDPPNQR